MHQKFGQEHMYNAMRRNIHNLKEEHNLDSDDDDVSGEEDDGMEQPNTEQSDSMDTEELILSDSGM